MINKDIAIVLLTASTMAGLHYIIQRKSSSDPVNNTIGYYSFKIYKDIVILSSLMTLLIRSSP